jgi:hypothetical protein
VTPDDGEGRLRATRVVERSWTDDAPVMRPSWNGTCRSDTGVYGVRAGQRPEDSLPRVGRPSD